MPLGVYPWDMSLTGAQVEQALLALDQSERAAVIHRGLQSLDKADAALPQDAVDSAWRSEIGKRIDEIESGDVELVDVNTSHAQLRDELSARRR